MGVAGSGGHAGSGGGGAGAGGETGLGGVGGLGGLGGLGGGTGGTAGTGGAGGMAIPCYATTFTAPASNNAMLTVNDDVDHSCADGFTYIVAINSGAPDNTPVSLYSGSTILQASTVMSGTASFSVRLASGSPPQSLAIQYPGTTTCNVSTMVTVTCPDNPPSCNLTQPVISATHPALNGTTDRANSAGGTYQVAFKVQTSAEDGQPVTLAIDNQANPSAVTTLNATASNGVATFTATFPADGTYEAIASCINKNGVTGTSTKGTYPVDTTAPDLTLNSPMSGQFVVGANVNVCGQTASPDAAGLAASLGPAQSNLCVTVGSAATPTCAPIAAVNTSTCVPIPCPGGAPFNLTVTLADAAGNPTTKTLTGLTCTSSLPAVQIIAPASDAPTFTDPTKHILAASAPTGLKDKDATTPGAQVDVVACTDAAGTAVLKVGHKGDPVLAQLGGSVATAAAVPGDNCPAGLPNVVRFSSVTLPESNENADGTLATATELTVTVTSSVNAQAIGISQPDDVWVDTVVPSLTLASPPDLCTQFMQSTTSVLEDVSFTADDKLVVLEVTNGATTTTYDTPAYMNGVATFPSVLFAQGENDITVSASDPAGNAVAFMPATATCAVSIGMAPAVTFTSPASGSLLCRTGATAAACISSPLDADPATAGWQGSLVVSVRVGGRKVTSGDQVTFTINGNSLGSANLDSDSNATLNGITLAEGVQTIQATTASIPGAGVGFGIATVTVDTLPPAAPGSMNVSLLTRRETSMQLTWKAPADADGGSVSGYEIRYAKVPIDASNFDTAGVTTAFEFKGDPLTPGQDVVRTISPLYIENNYYFAVKAIDRTGATSGLITNQAGSCDCQDGHCCAAHFKTTPLTGTAGTSNEGTGTSMDGSGDANGDGLSDLLVGSSNGGRAYLFFGSKPTPATSPSVTFTATATGFGRGAAYIGDIDNDGREDLAIAATSANQVFIYKGRASWPVTLADTDADYKITTDATYTNSSFGSSMSRLGDFNGDGIDDFAIGAPNFGGSPTFRGRVTIVLGAATGFAGFALPNTTAAITIDADPALATPFFGTRVLGIGHFYPGSATTLVVSAPGVTSASITSNNEGHIYAFRGQTGTAGVIDPTTADAVIAGTIKGQRLGAVLTNLGPIGGAGVASIGAGNPNDPTTPGSSGSLIRFSGTPTTSPFASSTQFYMSTNTLVGAEVIGGGIPGRDVALSLIGVGGADLVVVGRNSADCGIVDGAKVGSLTSPVDARTAADAIVPYPSGFGTLLIGGGTLLPDINGDGYPDFALTNAASNNAGLVELFW